MINQDSIDEEKEPETHNNTDEEGVEYDSQQGKQFLRKKSRIASSVRRPHLKKRKITRIDDMNNANYLTDNSSSI